MSSALLYANVFQPQIISLIFQTVLKKECHVMEGMCVNVMWEWLCDGSSYYGKHGHRLLTLHASDFSSHTLINIGLVFSFKPLFRNDTNMTSSYKLWKYYVFFNFLCNTLYCFMHKYIYTFPTAFPVSRISANPFYCILSLRA